MASAKFDIPSQNMDVAKRTLTIESEKLRTPNDLLHRALAHINYRSFDVTKLTIFEDPAIAVFNMYPKPANSNVKPAKRKRFKDYFLSNRQGMFLSVKVSPLDNTKQNFAVHYVVGDVSKPKRKKQAIAGLEDLPDTLIADMFGAIPDVSFI